VYVVSSEEMRTIDRYTIEEIGIPALVLMENAGRAAAEEIKAYAGERLRRIAVLVGKGNNGGDGIVTARHLIEAGYKVTLIYAENPSGFRNEAAVQRDIARNLDIPYCIYTPASVLWQNYDVIVDALLGTGSHGAPRGTYASLIQEANESRLPIFSIDIPSGLDPDTGQVYEPCVSAVCTIALAFTKRGLEQEPGARRSGRVAVHAIGIPQLAASLMKVRTFRIEEPLLSERLGLDEYRKRSSNTHKGTYGHVLVAAGSRNMSGAGLLCSKAALRAGCGLVTWALPGSLLHGMMGHMPEAMLIGLDDSGLGDWQAVPPTSLIELANEKSVLVLGPGVGRWENDSEWLRSVWEGTTCPLVLDADALNMISSSKDFKTWAKRSAPVIMTPHPGEMGRLYNKDTKDVQGNRIESARSFAEAHGVTLVLKGPHTVIASPEGEVYINPTGNAGMATGGTGDVLAGITAGLLAQGMSATQAAALGAYLHGAAGDRAAKARAFEASLIAGDILDHL
jgi:hydroxyethylthiazole kinase-like uncharacterized protein yjeF